jgi:ubiquinone/menaquinone biosynthesis C-methylase UbiE
VGKMKNNRKKLNSLIRSKHPNEIINRYGHLFLEYLREEKLRTFDNLMNFVEIIVTNAGIHGNVLDFGCGFGIHSIILSDFCDHVTSIDLNEEKISTLKKILAEIGVKNVKPVLSCHPSKLPFAEKTFDVTYCSEVISHVDDVAITLSEIHRVLKNDGKVIIADTGKWSWYGIWMVYVKRHKDENYFTLRQMRRILRSSGFKDVQRVKGAGAPRNPLKRVKSLWWLVKYVDPKYILVANK